VHAYVRCFTVGETGVGASCTPAIHDVAFSEVRRPLTYKCSWHGKILETVDRWYASRMPSRMPSRIPWSPPTQ